MGGGLWSVYTCLLAYAVGTALENFPPVVISGAITTTVMGVPVWRLRLRRSGGRRERGGSSGDRGIAMISLFPSLRGYRREWLRGDVIAGLTVWAVLVPEALAYASSPACRRSSGCTPPPGALLYAAFGSSRHLVAGPMSATAALSAAMVATDATAELRVHDDDCGLAIVPDSALLAGLLRLGFLAAFISEPVLKGFIVGLALTIISARCRPPRRPEGIGRLLREGLGRRHQARRHAGDNLVVGGDFAGLVLA